jgi:hypothetical protein
LFDFLLIPHVPDIKLIKTQLNSHSGFGILFGELLQPSTVGLGNKACLNIQRAWNVDPFDCLVFGHDVLCQLNNLDDL